MKVSGSRQSKGFTLVELLVVMLIIGLVSAATLPTISAELRQLHQGEALRLSRSRDLHHWTPPPADRMLWW